MACFHFFVCRTENSEMHQAKDKVKREQQLMYRENERLTKVIEKLEREINGYDVNFCRKMYFIFILQNGDMFLVFFPIFFIWSFLNVKRIIDLFNYKIILFVYWCDQCPVKFIQQTHTSGRSDPELFKIPTSKSINFVCLNRGETTEEYFCIIQNFSKLPE